MTGDTANSDETSGPRQVRRSRARAEQADARFAWYNLLQVSTRVIRELDRRLDLEHRISAREFDVLINLDNPAEDGLRMTELASAAMLSSGGLTRLVGRLEERGFVQRDQDTVDARAFQARLTDAGRARLAEARVTHDAVVHDLFGAHLSAGEVETMTRALARALGPDRRT
jgi:DNA-binding MarR family transcriptional regulator